LFVAQTLGKAVLVLTNNSLSLPSDVGEQHAFIYEDVTVGEDDFQRILVTKLQAVLQRIDNYGIVDTSHKSISVAFPQHWIHLKPELWNAFAVIIDRGKKVHHAVQSLEDNHLSRLKKLVDEILRGPQEPSNDDQASRIGDLPDFWDIYELTYLRGLEQLVSQNGHNNVQEDRTLSSYDVLIQYVQEFQDSSIGKNAIAHLEKSKGFYNHNKGCMNRYDIDHCEARGCLSNMGSDWRWNPLRGYDLTWNPSKGAELYRILRSLARNSRVISTNADSMILNLVNLLTSEA
jgi:hypothetical protein